MLANFVALEKINLDSSFSSQYYDFQQYGEEEDEVYPYDEALEEVFESLDNLKEFSICHFDQEQKVYFYKYSCSHDLIEDLRENYPKVRIIEDLDRHRL